MTQDIYSFVSFLESQKGYETPKPKRRTGKRRRSFRLELKEETAKTLLYQKYIKYIMNASGNRGVVKTEHFEEDWEPIGERVLQDMKKEGIVQFTKGGKVFLRPDIIEKEIQNGS